MEDSTLSKSLYQAVMKTLGSKEGMKNAADRIVSDIKDPNMIANIPDKDLPASKDAVLNKDSDLPRNNKQLDSDPSRSMEKTPFGSMMMSQDEIKGIHKLRRFLEKYELKKTAKLDKAYVGFEAVKEKAKASGARNPEAVAASVGRKKYGTKAFQAAAAAGRKMGKK